MYLSRLPMHLIDFVVQVRRQGGIASAGGNPSAQRKTAKQPSLIRNGRQGSIWHNSGFSDQQADMHTKHRHTQLRQIMPLV